MKVPMTKEIQSVICAIHDYSKYLRSYHHFVLNELDFDWWQEAENFYNKMPLPEGMNSSKACFNAVMWYPINDTIDTLSEELPGKFSFGF